MLTQKIQLGEEISVLAKKLAQEGKEVLCDKGFTKEQQEIAMRCVFTHPQRIPQPNCLKMEKRMYLQVILRQCGLEIHLHRLYIICHSQKSFCRSDI